MLGDRVKVIGLSQKIMNEPLCNTYLLGEIGYIMEGDFSTMFKVKMKNDKYERDYFFFPEELKLA